MKHDLGNKMKNKYNVNLIVPVAKEVGRNWTAKRLCRKAIKAGQTTEAEFLLRGEK